MSFKREKPTKSNLLRLKKKLHFSTKGLEYLNYKRDQLIFQIKEEWENYKNLRKKFLGDLKKAIIQLNTVYKHNFRSQVDMVCELSAIADRLQIEILYKKEFGIIIPEITVRREKKTVLPNHSLWDTDFSLETLLYTLKKGFLPIFFEFIESEDKMLKFTSTFKKISTRINGLKNIVIPELIRDIKAIQTALDEYERESFVRFKKTKDLIIHQGKK